MMLISHVTLFFTYLLAEDNEKAINILESLIVEDDIKPTQNKQKADKIEEMYKSINELLRYEDLEPIKSRIDKDPIINSQFHFYSSYFELEEKAKASIISRELIMYYKA